MEMPKKVCGTAFVVLALSIGLSACGSSEKPAAASPSSSTSSSASSSSKTTESKASPAPQAGAHESIADYLKEAGITETPVKRGDPGSPTIDLPVPDGWEVAGPKTPEWAYGAILSTDPAVAADPPSVIAVVSKLTGPVDKAKLIEYAPGELQNLPGFDAMGGNGQTTTLSGFDGYQFGGSYVKDGVKRMIAQKTIIIPAKDGASTYVLQMNADGTEDQMTALMDVTSAIDEKTTITP